MSVALVESRLPGNQQNIFGIPTADRWKTSLPGSLRSFTDALDRSKGNGSTMVFVSDGSVNSTPDEIRFALDQTYEGQPPKTQIYISTMQDRLKLAAILKARLPHIDPTSIDGIVLDPSCGGNRENTKAVAGAHVLDTSDSITMVLADDDVQTPLLVRWSKDGNGHPNTHMIYSRKHFPYLDFDLRQNADIHLDFMDLPGLTLQQMRENQHRFRAQRGVRDTMHDQLRVAQREGKALFEFNPEGDNVPEGLIVAASVLKHYMPDYRTVEVARAYLLDEFPKTELIMHSFPAGQNEPFGHEVISTNLDMALSAWLMNDETVSLPHNFITNPNIPFAETFRFKTVSSRTRADNEPATIMLEHARTNTGKQYLYLGAPTLQAEHYRDPGGYRPHIIEQACTSLVDHEYAVAAVALLHYDGKHAFMITDEIKNWKMPEQNAINVYQKLQDIAQVSEDKIGEIEQRQSISYSAENQKKIDEYRRIIQLLKDKLAVTEYEKLTGETVPIAKWLEVGFIPWKDEIDAIGIEQILRYSHIVRDAPDIMREIKKVIREGMYPIHLVVPNGDPKISIPGKSVTSYMM